MVLGARIGLYALVHLGLLPPDGATRFDNGRKRLYTFVEIDGCGADGIATAVDCRIERRTLRVEDYGKLAATCVDRETGRALRVAPAPAARERALAYAAGARSRWHAYRAGYLALPDTALLVAQPVALTVELAVIISRAAARAVCAACGEEVMNEREVLRDGRTLCRACADGGYFRPLNVAD